MYSTKTVVDPALIGDTSYGAAGNTTSVPGWSDVAGNVWRLLSGYVDAVDSSSNNLLNVYSFNNQGGSGEEDQRIIFDVPAGEGGNTLSFRFRRTLQGASTHAIRVYWQIAGAVHVYSSRASGGYAEVPRGNSGAIGLNGAKKYRVTLTVSGTGASTQVAATIYNLTDGIPHIWNAGSDTWVFGLTADDAQIGDVRMLAHDPGRVSYLEYQSQGVSPDITIGAVTRIITDTSITLTPSVTGGSGSYTYQWYEVADVNETPSGSNIISGATNLTLARTGLDPAQNYIYRLVVTDSLDATATAPIGAWTKREEIAEELRILQVGDSITAGGSPPSVETAITELIDRHGYPDTSEADFYANVGGTTPSLLNNVSGAWDAMLAEIDALDANYVWLRMGYNDVASGISASDSADARKQVAINILAQRPSVLAVILLHHTATWTFFEGQQSPSDARATFSEDVQTLMSAPGYSTEKIIVGPITDYDLTANNPEFYLTPDGTHPIQDGYDALGKNDADWFAIWHSGGIVSYQTQPTTYPMDPLLKAIQEAVGSTRSDAELGVAPLQQDDLEKIFIAATGRKWMGSANPQERRPVFSPTPPIHPPSNSQDVAPAVRDRIPANDPSR